MVEIISAQKAQELLREGAKFIDIRSADEFNRENIVNSTNVESKDLASYRLIPTLAAAPILIFYCQSGVRTKNAQPNIEQFASEFRRVYILDGGIKAWKDRGYETNFDPNQGLPIMRQVQIAAGSLVLLGTILALFAKFFLIITGFVGVGLIFAGLTGNCLMAELLDKYAPWNKK